MKYHKIYFTFDQLQNLKPLFAELAFENAKHDRVAIIGQVYPDGVIASVIHGDAVDAIQAATGAEDAEHFFLSDRDKQEK